MTDSTKPLDESADPEVDQPTPEPAADAPASVTPEDPEAVARQRDEYCDLLLRKTAEFDNYRKRTDRERRELADYAAAELLAELLPVVDDLERALASPADEASAAAYRAGVELIHKQMLELLAKRGVMAIVAVGQPFDPHFHQAVAREVGTPEQDGLVIEEFRRGYMQGDRLLRAAMVKVGTS